MSTQLPQQDIAKTSGSAIAASHGVAPSANLRAAFDQFFVTQLRVFRSGEVQLAIAAILVFTGSVGFAMLFPQLQLWTEFAARHSPTIILVLLTVVAGAVAVRQLVRASQSAPAAAPCIETIGPYVLKERLGSGGMGEVFLAEHHLMKRDCAVKLIHPRNARDEKMRANFECEAKATARLTHWNTIEIYDYGTSVDGRFYYVMEYLKGMNLWHHVQQFGPMPPGRVVYLLKQLCDALHEADCAGLVHRDIKPSNIFLTERGQSFDVVKLLDFGLVTTFTKKPIKLNNVSRTLRGSPSFMCPEQAVGRTPDSRGDLYSLGAVAYFLLTGRPPYVDENPIMLIVAHATASVPAFEELGIDVPADLAAIILKCLAREPDDRFDSARQLRSALETCECGSEWSWQFAEDWWKEHAESTVGISGVEHRESIQTSASDEDTSPEFGQASKIDHEEPTAMYAVPN
ncbi:serine/threonine protein kinase [Fuerstiella marisgermanici]|uniref:Serine/threonine-protein kinase Pkn1 n=1 Tax=Fuerstiella marisgermanici TaxID=1891926 RepID=A0A1P8WDU3_9PLAN|nr:serine/threonine-protein kinase [Fuerstiella marisgermanici]APZ92201.1 Serine/threonine-protein kinase Pkn1 [Fuerstiella marisgermanici]